MTDRINKLMYILDRSEEVLKLTQILAPFFCFTFCTSPPYRVKYPPVCLKGQISTLQRNRSMEGGVQVQSKKKKCRNLYISTTEVNFYIFLIMCKMVQFVQICKEKNLQPSPFSNDNTNLCSTLVFLVQSAV